MRRGLQCISLTNVLALGQRIMINKLEYYLNPKKVRLLFYNTTKNCKKIYIMYIMS